MFLDVYVCIKHYRSLFSSPQWVTMMNRKTPPTWWSCPGRSRVSAPEHSLWRVRVWKHLWLALPLYTWATIHTHTLLSRSTSSSGACPSDARWGTPQSSWVSLSHKPCLLLRDWDDEDHVYHVLSFLLQWDAAGHRTGSGCSHLYIFTHINLFI